MNEIETIIYNNGEVLIPHITHNEAEYIRHLKSYEFFKNIIIKNNVNNNHISILDIGCGVGWGCKVLSEIPNSRIIGFDINKITIEYAEKNYCKNNISYFVIDIKDFINYGIYYDYIVARGSFEHIDNSLEIISSLKFNKQLIFDIPYNEPTGKNRFHKLIKVTEKTFENFENKEIYYEDINGLITKDIQNKPNMLMIILNK